MQNFEIRSNGKLVKFPNGRRKYIQDAYIRVCKDSGFQIEYIQAAILAANVLDCSPLEIWMAFSGLGQMEEIATGRHRRCSMDKEIRDTILKIMDDADLHADREIIRLKLLDAPCLEENLKYYIEYEQTNATDIACNTIVTFLLHKQRNILIDLMKRDGLGSDDDLRTLVALTEIIDYNTVGGFDGD